MQTPIRFLLIALGILLAVLGIEGFLIPNRFIDGGVTGLSMLISELTPIPLPVLLVTLNTPFLLVGIRQFKVPFFIRGLIGIVLFAVCLTIIHIPVLTTDKLLASIFGGLCLGSGIGLAIRGGGVLDGTEIAALILNKRSFLSVGNLILLCNIVIFSIAAFFLGLDRAMYSVLTYLSASRMVDFVVYGVDASLGIFIISEKSEVIRHMIINDMGRAVTVFRGKGGFSKEDQDILFCVVSHFEVTRFKTMINSMDPQSFVIMHRVSESLGGMVKKLSH
ncbi:hypothetical protein DID80_02820 [Candidatus Marinamargulisbacteria bacterium SCGC AAA071-K20]|nr:hypothetical protein DID80_02820 [Candidatus Marinamargulisbacteria bacterium SCGC AAA071-K20]